MIFVLAVGVRVGLLKRYGYFILFGFPSVLVLTGCSTDPVFILQNYAYERQASADRLYYTAAYVNRKKNFAYHVRIQFFRNSSYYNVFKVYYRGKFKNYNDDISSCFIGGKFFTYVINCAFKLHRAKIGGEHCSVLHNFYAEINPHLFNFTPNFFGTLEKNCVHCNMADCHVHNDMQYTFFGKTLDRLEMYLAEILAGSTLFKWYHVPNRFIAVSVPILESAVPLSVVVNLQLGVIHMYFKRHEYLFAEHSDMFVNMEAEWKNDVEKIKFITRVLLGQCAIFKSKLSLEDKCFNLIVSHLLAREDAQSLIYRLPVPRRFKEGFMNVIKGELPHRVHHAKYK